MNSIELVMERINKLTNIIAKNAKTPRDYGIGIPLYASEIHLLCTIHAHPETNADGLSQLLGISNAAIHKATGKLIEKQLITARNIDGNRKAVYYSLTATGETAVAGHTEHHKQLCQYVDSMLTDTSQNRYTIVLDFLGELIDSLQAKED